VRVQREQAAGNAESVEQEGEGRGEEERRVKGGTMAL